MDEAQQLWQYGLDNADMLSTMYGNHVTLALYGNCYFPSIVKVDDSSNLPIVLSGKTYALVNTYSKPK